MAASFISPWYLALLLAWANCVMAQAASVAAPTAAPSSASLNAADVGAALQNTHVLLVGIEDYGRDSKLAGPARDLCALYQTYVAALELSPRNITVLLSPGRFGPASPCAAVPVRAATRSELLAQLRQQGSRLDSSSRLLIHFSGHGIERKGEQLLLLADGDTATDQTVGLSELATALRAPGAKQAEIAIFLDACRETLLLGDGSNTTSEPAAALHLKSHFLGFDRVVAFAAAEPGGRSYIRPHSATGRPIAPISYFTWSVIKAMLGLAGDSSHWMPASEMHAYLASAVPEMMAFEFGAVRVRQQPVAEYLNEASRSVRVPVRRRAGNPDSFFFFAEARVEPVDADGKALASPSSFDVALPLGAGRFNEYSALTPNTRPFPGPFLMPLSIDPSLPVPARWRYTVRTVFMFARQRVEVIVCDSAPNAPQSAVHPEVKTSIDASGNLVIDTRTAFRVWGQQIGDLMIREEEEPRPPAHVRKPNPGCVVAAGTQ